MDAVFRRSKLVIAALVLALVALAGLALDTLTAHRTDSTDGTRPFELLLLGCAAVGLVCVIVMIVRNRPPGEVADDGEPPIDLRERLGPYVDLDDRTIDRRMDSRA